MLVAGPLKLGHVAVARADVLRLDVVPGPVDVHAVAAHRAENLFVLSRGVVVEREAWGDILLGGVATQRGREANESV